MYFQFHKQVFYQENSKYITKNIPTTPITSPNTITYIAQISLLALYVNTVKVS
jgi:hypothetical protein